MRSMGAHVVHLLVACLVSSVFFSDAHARQRGPKRTQPVTMIVLHSTGGPTCDARTGKAFWVRGGTMQDNLRTIEAHPRLGIHYMIDRDGTLRASVPEDEVAHHVYTHSAHSIAVELINDGDGVDPFTPPQVDALVRLLRELVRRHGIARDGVVRHSDLDRGTMPCEPGRRRKVDPGDAYPHAAVLERVFAARP
jgi:N-acetylmuramoyl-L-alanine amidase